MRNLRLELEQMVCSVNAPLKEKVPQMDLIELLRNIHPLYRSDYAYLLLRAGQINNDQSKEFTKVL